MFDNTTQPRSRTCRNIEGRLKFISLKHNLINRQNNKNINIET